MSVQPPSAGLQSSSPPVVTVLQPPPEPPPVEIPKLLMPPADMTQVVEEVTHSMSQNEAFMHHLQQVRASTSSCRLTDEMLVMEDVTPGKIKFVIFKKAVFLKSSFSNILLKSHGRMLCLPATNDDCYCCCCSRQSEFICTARDDVKIRTAGSRTPC